MHPESGNSIVNCRIRTSLSIWWTRKPDPTDHSTLFHFTKVQILYPRTRCGRYFRSHAVSTEKCFGHLLFKPYVTVHCMLRNPVCFAIVWQLVISSVVPLRSQRMFSNNIWYLQKSLCHRRKTDNLIFVVSLSIHQFQYMITTTAQGQPIKCAISNIGSLADPQRFNIYQSLINQLFSHYFASQAVLRYKAWTLYLFQYQPHIVS